MKKQGLMRPAQALAALLVVIAPCLAEKAMGEGSKAMDEGFCTTVTLNSSFYCAGLVANISVPSTLQLSAADSLARWSIHDNSIPECEAYHSKELQCARFFPRCNPTDGSLSLLCPARCMVTMQACDAYDALVAQDFCASSSGFATIGAHCFSVPFDLETVQVDRIIFEILLVTVGLLVASMLTTHINGNREEQLCRRDAFPKFDFQVRCCTSKQHEQLSTEEISMESLAVTEPPGEEEGAHPRECRICKDDDAQDQLFAPCQCQGSMALVHTVCLSQWIAAQYENELQGQDRDPMVCEVCTTRYRAVVERAVICDKKHLLSAESMVQYASCFVILLMLPLLVLLLVRSCEQASVFKNAEVTDLDYAAYSSNLCTQSSHWGVVAMGVLFLLLMLSSLHKAYSSWRLINERMTVRPDVD